MEKPELMEGTLFKIKRFSIHDGPGIRTAVFLKGCQMKCTWCHSPEGISSDILLWYNKNLCITCGQCIEACPTKALTLSDDAKPIIKIDQKACRLTSECIKTCPSKALKFTGYKITVADVIKEIEKDLPYYQTSGGGVTLTGGEPLYQPEFSAEILKACKDRKIHTAIETSLYCSNETIKLIMPQVDLFIVDIKILDRAQHILYTGRSNESIKGNFRLLASLAKVLVRIPLIENITDTADNKNAILNFIREINEGIQVQFIPYNPLTGNNYSQLGLHYTLTELRVPVNKFATDSQIIE